MNAAEGQPLARATAWKIVASVVAVVGAVGALLYMSASPAIVEYKHVDEVMANVGHFQGKRVDVHGYVVPGSILQNPGTLEYKFKVESKAPRQPAVLPAEFTGIVPDNFQSGAEVVVKATLTADNRLQIIPDGIIGKCPSKYDSKQPQLKDPGTAPAPGAYGAPATTPSAATAQK